MSRLLACCLLGFLVVLLPFWRSGPLASPPASTPLLEFDLGDRQTQGAVSAERGFSVTATIPADGIGDPDSLVAIFDSPSFARRMLPFLANEDGNTLTATADFEPSAAGRFGVQQKAVAVRVNVARKEGMALRMLYARSVYVTLAPRRPQDGSSKRSFESLQNVSVTPESTTVPNSSPVDVQEETLLESPVQEESLLERRSSQQSPGYWKLVQRQISRHLRQYLGPHLVSLAIRNPTVQFRLYANGDAQLIQVEHSSGSPEVDDATLRAVVSAHPFPPFPIPTSDPHIDVHFDVPVLSP